MNCDPALISLGTLKAMKWWSQSVMDQAEEIPQSEGDAALRSQFLAEQPPGSPSGMLMSTATLLAPGGKTGSRDQFRVCSGACHSVVSHPSTTCTGSGPVWPRLPGGQLSPPLRQCLHNQPFMTWGWARLSLQKRWHHLFHAQSSLAWMPIPSPGCCGYRMNKAWLLAGRDHSPRGKVIYAGEGTSSALGTPGRQRCTWLGLAGEGVAFELASGWLPQHFPAF